MSKEMGEGVVAATIKRLDGALASLVSNASREVEDTKRLLADMKELQGLSVGGLMLSAEALGLGSLDTRDGVPQPYFSIGQGIGGLEYCRIVTVAGPPKGSLKHKRYRVVLAFIPEAE